MRVLHLTGLVVNEGEVLQNLSLLAEKDEKYSEKSVCNTLCLQHQIWILTP